MMGTGKVRIGQVWDFVGEHTDALPDARGWRCIVVAPNDSREAGPDSWRMWCSDDRGPRKGRAMYMHHRARVSGQWRRLSWWRLLCERIWAGERWPKAPATELPGGAGKDGNG